MSSLASGAEPRLSRPHTRTITVPWAGPGGWLTGAVALAILLATFVGRGGVRLQPTTVTEIGLMLAGAGLVAAACLRPGPARLHGVPLVIAFALLTVYTALSIAWSLAPADSWLEANRTLAYLAVLAGGVALVRLLPGQWPGLLYGVLAGTVLVCAWALLTKVFPGALAADETLARLRAPYEYWNSVGLTAAMAVPPLLWLAARRTGYGVASAMAWPLLGLRPRLPDALLLARRADRAGDRARDLVRSRCRCGCGRSPRSSARRVGAVPVVAWAFAQDGLTVDRAPMAARADAGHELGALLAAAGRRARRRGARRRLLHDGAPAGRAHAARWPAAACSGRSHSCRSRS